MTFVLNAAISNCHALLDAISKTDETITEPTQMTSRNIYQLDMEHVEYKQVRAFLVPISPDPKQPVASITVTEPKD